MNKWQKILTVVALIAFSAIIAEAKIGDTQDQVIRFAQKQEDIAQIRTRTYGGYPVIDVVYTDSTTLMHFFGANDREIAQYLYAPKRLTDAQVKEIQRIYHTIWRGTGTEGGHFMWESYSGLLMGAERHENYDELVILDMTRSREIASLNAKALPAPSRWPASTETNVYPPAPAATPNPAPGKKDCLITATIKLAELKPSGCWARIAGFAYSKNLPGHAVVLYQPTSGSNVWMYDEDLGSLELATQSHDLRDLAPAINQRLQLLDSRYQVSNLRWVEKDI